MREHFSDFDFAGLIIIIAGVVLILLGFNFSENSCTCRLLSAPYEGLLIFLMLHRVYPRDYSPISHRNRPVDCRIVQRTLHEAFTDHSASTLQGSFPIADVSCPGLPTTNFPSIDAYNGSYLDHRFLPCLRLLCWLVLPAGVLPSPRLFCHRRRRAVSPFMSFRFSSRLTKARRMLPFSLSGALMSIVSGQIISRTGRWRPVMWVAWAVMTLGWGLMITLDDTSNM